MPKILINEKDYTSPGTPGSYGNYTVLITGYQKEFTSAQITAANTAISDYKTAIATKSAIIPVLDETATMIMARQEAIDANGAYEFNSKQAFEDIIGECSDEKTFTILGEEDPRIETHYGNRMARELLSLGYPIIYKPIQTILDMNDEAFWECFKDKANYDFRFISHGMLETVYSEEALDELKARLDDVKLDVAKFKEVEDAEDYESYLSAEAVNKKSDGSLYFTDGSLQYSYDQALIQYTEEDGVIPAISAAEEAIAAYDTTAITPTVFNNINAIIANLASYKTGLTAGRGDCTALIELDEKCYVSGVGKPEHRIVNGINAMTGINGNVGAYCAMTVPSVYYKGIVGKLPGAFHYLACFMNSISSGFAEWYAVAGYTRGVSSYIIDRTSVKLGEIAINTLEPRNIIDQSSQPKFACNVIANFRGSYYLWGNRTAEPVQQANGGGDLVASHFLNIRQLCSTIKKQLYVSCRRFTFDPNSDTLWYSFTGSIVPTLEKMKADQGIRDYKIIKVRTDKKATLKAKIRIIPVEAVEDFDIEISLEDSFGETSVVANG